MADKQKFRFIDKPKAEGSTTSVILSGISLVLMLASFVLSFIFGGRGSTLLGAMGLCAFALSIYGFILGLMGLNQKRVDHKWAFIGTLACGFVAIMWLAIYFVGLK